MAAETSAPVNPAPPAAEAPPVKKIVFRLDDGTVIRRTGDSHDAEVLRPKQAWEAGLLHEHHLLRMQHFLCQIHSKLPEEGPLKSVSIGSKRSMDSVLEVRLPNFLAPTLSPHFSLNYVHVLSCRSTKRSL